MRGWLALCLGIGLPCVVPAACGPRHAGPPGDDRDGATSSDADPGADASSAAETAETGSDAGCHAGCTMCVGGRCAIEIDQGEEHPYGVVVDGTRVYWSRTFTSDPASASIRVAPLAGGPAADLYPNLNTPHTLVRDQRYLYWTQIVDNGGIWRAPLDGSASPEQLAFNQAQPHGLAIDATHLYWTNFGGVGDVDAGYVAGTILKMPIAGGAPQILAQGQRSPNNVAVDSQFVYWTNWTDLGSVMRVPIDGGNAEPVTATLQHLPYGIAVDARNLYWTNNDGTVWKQPLAGGPAIRLAQGQTAAPFSIAIDDTWVYWSNYDVTGTGGLFKVAIAGGDPIMLVSAESYGFAIDATSIYWTNYLGGTVWKMTPR